MHEHRFVALGWFAVAFALLSLAAMLTAFGDKFAWLHSLSSIPSLELAAGYILAGAIFTYLIHLIPAAIGAGWQQSWRFLAFVFIVGLLMRAILLVSVPALEDDFYRYLWDGGVTAHGLNPYGHAPGTIYHPDTAQALQALAAQSGPIIERVNHPHLKTIYPPAAQAWFALAHVIEPWSLLAWRIVGIGCELVTFTLLLLLLQTCGRSPIWVALYWWNPVAAKELINSAHMEFVLLPMVLLALWLGTQRRYLASTFALALAVGTKLWPVMLLPLLLKPLLKNPIRLFAALMLFGSLCLVWAIPPYFGGLDQTSGFVAFAKHWQTNSALFQNINRVAAPLGLDLSLTAETTGILVRLGLAAAVAAIALAVARTHYDTPHDFVVAAAWIVGAQFLLSPVQFPWYATWVFILLPLTPLPGLIAITVTIPLYYASFYFASIGRYDLFNTHVLWIIWMPVWLLLLRDAWRAWHHPLNWKADA